MKLVKPILVILSVSILTACLSGEGFVSVNKKFGDGGGSKEFHEVHRGDTLYSIAWRYGLDFRQLAAVNSISPPYTIYPGQKIDIKYDLNQNPAPSVSVNKPSKPTPTQQETTQVKANPVSKPPKVTPSVAVSGWQWPLQGKLIGRFSTKEPVNKGIDIASSLGESVMAAAAGTVVYAGTGVRGYGNLVIVRHNDEFLSAYAHASRVLVRENQKIKAGEKIAETGSTGTDKVKLHFEIRKNGKPVNPLSYLPKK